MNVNTYDRLLDACDDPSSYPAQLLRSELFPYALRRYTEFIHDREFRVFSRDSESEYWRIRFYDSDYLKGFPSTPHFCDSIGQLKDYLLEASRKDPKCRHLFIRANHSRAPLDCSREMLSFAFTFHQVMAQFLDVVLHFGTFPGLNVPTSFHHCVFRHECFTEPGDASRFSVPELGRSGMEIKHCYNLWAVEKSDLTYGNRAWEIRQAGLYHSLDVLNGKATWVHLKTNKLLESRITEAYKSPEFLKACDLQTVQGSFSATLMTHLIVFEWCGENWRQYLNHWECELERILTTIRNAPIDKVEKMLVDVNSNIAGISGPPARQLSISPTTRIGTISSRLTGWNSPRSATFMSDSSTLPQSSLIEKHVGQGKTECSWPPVSKATEQNFSPPMAPAAENGQTSPEKDAFQIFDEFKYKDLQRLHTIGSKLHEADMIMTLDADILLKVVEYFKDFLDDLRTPRCLKDECQAVMSKFVQRTKGIVREFEADRRRISTLITLLNDGKALFDAITQFRNMELNRQSSARMEIMTKEMHQSTLQMEDISSKTEKETSSMHIITLVTLLFLPGTFVATFLGAGFFQWPDTDDASDIPRYPVWRPEYFFLFAKISFPLMALTLLFWAWPYLLRTISPRRPCSVTTPRQWLCGIGRQKVGDEEAQTASNSAQGCAGILPRWQR